MRDFSQRLGKFIDTEHNFVEGGLVIALSSKFGSGKSTFLKMWSSYLEEVEDKPLVVSLNAWESDYNGDPLFAVVSALAKAVQMKGEAPDDLIEAARDSGWFATAIGSQLVHKFIGIDPAAAGEVAEKKKVERLENERVPMDAFSIYEGRRAAMKSLKEAIRGLVASSSPRALFIVDELDRCRPDYAISYLETIKHIFDIKGAIFILSADRQQLENSAKTAFGNDLDFEEYYRKFVHREVTLPPISTRGYVKLAEEYVTYYLVREGSRICFMGLDKERFEDLVELFGALRLTPRQLQEVFRTLGHMFETSEDNKGRLLWCLGVGSVTMAAFRVGAPDVFHSLGKKQLEPVDAVGFLKRTMGDSHLDWWFSLFFTGGGLRTKEGESAEDVYKRAGLVDANESMVPRDLGHWRSGWGHHSSNRFGQIYDKIEQISQWG
ncbi:KAP family P-loop NTPase fold protein [Thiocapsa rosea]|uniref:KAP family P-loop NTPase fold protein n=1 Tax=Thiocapsa rosea TaxID=69360 RepID=UPI001473FE4F|nr:P-loop NTPase fold protein [Thiocapsa rosea]